MNELALFAGAGGGILGGHLLGWRTVCAVEFDSFCARRLMQRQNEGHLPPFPIWDDVRTFDGRPWRGTVDVVSGGFPCQDISVAGRGAGIGGERSGLWSEMARIIGEVRPKFAFVENSPRLSVLGLYRVLGDLAELGFDAEWDVVSAKDAGANHLRKRMWIVGRNPDSCHACGIGRPVSPHLSSPQWASPKDVEERHGWKPELGSVDVAERVPSYAGALRVLHGMADRVDRLEALGNGQVPAVVRLAWETLTGACGVNPHVTEGRESGTGGWA